MKCEIRSQVGSRASRCGRKKYCDIAEDEEDVNNLDDIFQYLDHWKENDFFDPEMQVDCHDGDFNIEYVLIADENLKEIWRDEEYKGII